MIKKWAHQGLTEDIEGVFGINAEAIVAAIKEELLKISPATMVTKFLQLGLSLFFKPVM